MKKVNKDTRLTLRLTTEQREAIEMAAKRENKSISQYVVSAAVKLANL